MLTWAEASPEPSWGTHQTPHSQGPLGSHFLLLEKQGHCLLPGPLGAPQCKKPGFLCGERLWWELRSKLSRLLSLSLEMYPQWRPKHALNTLHLFSGLLVPQFDQDEPEAWPHMQRSWKRAGEAGNIPPEGES